MQKSYCFPRNRTTFQGAIYPSVQQIQPLQSNGAKQNNHPKSHTRDLQSIFNILCIITHKPAGFVEKPQLIYVRNNIKTIQNKLQNQTKKFDG